MSKKKIFLTFSNSYDDFLSKLDKETKGVVDILEESKNRQFKVIHRSGIGIDDIFNRFKNNQDIEYYHYGGHANPESLSVNGEGLENEPFYKDNFVSLLEEQKKLEFIFLNGCQTGTICETIINQRIVDKAIGTLYPVDDFLSSRFSIEFYSCLSLGFTIQKAFHHAKNKLIAFSRRSRGGKRGAYFDINVRNEFPWKLYVPKTPKKIIIPTKLNRVNVNRIDAMDNFESFFSKMKDFPVQHYFITGTRNQAPAQFAERLIFEIERGEALFLDSDKKMDYDIKVTNDQKRQLTFIKLENFPKNPKLFKQFFKRRKKLNISSFKDLMVLEDPKLNNDYIAIIFSIPFRFWNKGIIKQLEYVISKFCQLSGDYDKAKFLFFYVVELWDSYGLNLLKRLRNNNIKSVLNDLSENHDNVALVKRELEAVSIQDFSDWFENTANLTPVDSRSEVTIYLEQKEAKPYFDKKRVDMVFVLSKIEDYLLENQPNIDR